MRLGCFTYDRLGPRTWLVGHNGRPIGAVTRLHKGRAWSYGTRAGRAVGRESTRDLATVALLRSWRHH